MSAKTLLQQLFGQKAWINTQWMAEVGHLDPAAHAAEHHGAIRTLNHILVVDRIFIGQLTGQPHGYTATNTSPLPSLSELRAAVAATDAWYLDYLARLPEAALDERLDFTFVDGDAGRMTRGEILAHVAVHGMYHRGGVGRILQQAGVAPPRDLLSKYLHDTEPQRRA